VSISFSSESSFPTSQWVASRVLSDLRPRRVPALCVPARHLSQQKLYALTLSPSSGVPLRGSASSAVQSNAVGLRQPVQVSGSIWCAMAQRNAAISRAIAAMTTGVFLPAA
jgi:hypothetical protein